MTTQTNKPGRPREHKTRPFAISIVIREEHLALAKKIGGGNTSAGVRMALEKYYRDFDDNK